MLTAELRINGRLIGHAYMLNITGATPDLTDPGAANLYSWEVYDVGGATHRGSVTHDRDAGAWALLGKVITAYRRQSR